ncbi:MAG: polysaccharide deacetylase family protein, partial [Propionicimonas sp.]
SLQVLTAVRHERAAFPLPSEIADGAADSDPSVPAEPGPGEGVAEPVDCAQAKCVALTLDDGPVPGTATVLDLFAKEKVRATFFVLGRNAKAHSKLIRRMIAEGHLVGNHSWSHPEFWKTSKAKIRKQLVRTDRLLAALGARPTLMRPPYGEWDARVAAVTRSLDLAAILWSVDPVDWRSRNTKKVVKQVLRQVKRGSIILTHDSLKPTRKAYPAIIKGLRAKGYTLVTVTELLDGNLRAGKRYFRA